MPASDRFILNRLTIREEQLHQTDDALDVKASILLVAITFIAGQSALFLHGYSKTSWQHREQILAVAIAFLVGGVLAYVLRVGSYPGEAAEGFSDWRTQIQEEVPTRTDGAIENEMISGLVPLLTDRVSKLYKDNQKKSNWLGIAHWSTIVALVLNFVVLASLI